MSKVGRWGSFTGVQVSGFQDAIEDALREYGDVVYRATEEGLDAAAYTLVDALRAATPKIKNAPKGYKRRQFAKRWKTSGHKYKMIRFVGNSTTVPGKGGEIALTNIFEYSTTRGAPFVSQTYENAVDKMVAAAVAEIKKEV